MGALVVLMTIVMVVVFVLIMSVRSVSLDEIRTEDRLHDPHVHTAAYAVPDGVDPAVIVNAVQAAGFTCVVDPSGPTEHVVVGCEEADRPRLRSVIEALPVTRYDGTPLRERVVFEDER